MAEDSEKEDRSSRMDKRKNNPKSLNQTEKEKMLIKVMAGFFILIVVIVVLMRFAGPHSTSDYSTPYEIVGNNLVFPASSVGTSAQYFKYDTGSKDVKFFAVKGSDGDIHTAFDACDVCFQEEKGYEQAGSKMRCRNCGNQYSTNQIGTTNQGGGCWPGYMERTVQDGNVLISLDELKRGKRYFP